MEAGQPQRQGLGGDEGLAAQAGLIADRPHPQVTHGGSGGAATLDRGSPLRPR
jgi:hypothetical protein